MKQQVLKNLTTSERLALLGQIFVPQGGHRLEFSSCALSDMDYLFDFGIANLVETKWTANDGGLNVLIEKIEHLLAPETEQKFSMGMPYMIHVIIPCEPITAQSVIGWLEHDEPIAIEHFVTTTNKDDAITARIVFIKNEIGNKIADEALRNNRITTNMSKQDKLKQALQTDLPCNDKGYFDSYLCNIYGGIMTKEFQKMFDNADGSELHSKAEAIHSSSMLTYNFFHWINERNPFKYDGVEYVKVFFEVRMKTLRNSNHPSNMDVLLVDKDQKNFLFIESKFTEYFDSKPWKLSDKYKTNNAFNKNVEWDEIISQIEKLINKSQYNEGIKQLITHLFGIANLCDESALEWFNTRNLVQLYNLSNNPSITFLNLIFEPHNRFKQEHECYDNYTKLLENAQKVIDNQIMIGNSPLKIMWTSYSEMWEKIKNQLELELRGFLWQRYMRFAANVAE